MARQGKRPHGYLGSNRTQVFSAAPSTKVGVFEPMQAIMAMVQEGIVRACLHFYLFFMLQLACLGSRTRVLPWQRQLQSALCASLLRLWEQQLTAILRSRLSRVVLNWNERSARKLRLLQQRVRMSRYLVTGLDATFDTRN